MAFQKPQKKEVSYTYKQLAFETKSKASDTEKRKKWHDLLRFGVFFHQIYNCGSTLRGQLVNFYHCNG